MRVVPHQAAYGDTVWAARVLLSQQTECLVQLGNTFEATTPQPNIHFERYVQRQIQSIAAHSHQLC